MKSQAQIEKEQKGLRKLIFLGTLIIIMLSILAQGCQEACKNTYMHYEPVYASLSEVRVTADFIAPQPLESPGNST